METLLHAGLGNALAAALLALLVAGVGVVARRPALMHALWVVVLLKLIAPPLWCVPVGPIASGDEGPSVGRSDRAESSPGIAALAESSLAEGTSGGWGPSSGPGRKCVAPGPEDGPQPPEEILRVQAEEVVVVEAPPRESPSRLEGKWSARRAPGWRAVVASAWVAGTLVTFGIAAVRVRRFGRLLKDARPAPRDLVERVGELSARLGLSRTPSVSMMPGVVSPMLWALGSRPRLIVPDDLWERLDGAQRDTLLVHELAHLKRRDHWVRGLELLATGLYWWHPVVWGSRRALREAEEQCCDAWVVWALPGAAKTYAEALLDTVDFLSGAGPSVPWAASGLGHVRHLKRRLVMILNGNTPRALGGTGILATLGLCTALLPLSPSWAQDSPDSKPSEIVEERVERAPDPDRPGEDVLKFNFNLKFPDQAVIHEEIVTRIGPDALKPLQKQLDELAAKGELSKEDEARRTAIQHAIKELERVLGDRDEAAASRSEESRERDRRRGDRRPSGREGREESEDRVESIPRSEPTADEFSSDDPKYQGYQEKIAALKAQLDRLRRVTRSSNDPAFRRLSEQFKSAQEEMAAYRDKMRGVEDKKRAELEKAREELQEQRSELTRKRAEFMEAERRYQEARRRLAEMERPGQGGDGAPPILSFRPVRELRRGFPFPAPGGRPSPMIAPDPRPGSPPILGADVDIRVNRPQVQPLPPDDSSRRISDLEKKLERLLQEVEGLKKEKAPKSE